MKAARWVPVVGIALTAASLTVWAATGAEGFTRWPDARLERADAPPAAGESELLLESGFSDGTPARPDIQSRFALGLFPSGADPAHLLSVATVAGASLCAAVVVFGAHVRRRAAGTTTTQGDHR